MSAYLVDVIRCHHSFQNYQLSVFHDPFDAVWFYSIFLAYNAFSSEQLIPDVFQ